MLHLCLYPAWLLYCIWGQKCSILVPKLGFLVASFQILIFFPLGPSPMNWCLCTTCILQRWEAEHWVAGKNGAELFSPPEPVLTHPSCAQAHDREKELTNLYPKPPWLPFAFGAVHSPIFGPTTEERFGGTSCRGGKDNGRYLFWSSLSIRSVCQSTGTPPAGHKIPFGPTGSYEAPVGWEPPVTTYVSVGAWMGTWRYFKISWKLHSSVVGSRSFASQVKWHNFLLPQGTLVTLGKKLCCL